MHKISFIPNLPNSKAARDKQVINNHLKKIHKTKQLHIKYQTKG